MSTLTLTVEETELFDKKNKRFVKVPPVTVRIKHSLLSISKWEERFERPFLPSMFNPELSNEEWVGYLECMVLGTPPDKNTLRYVWNKFQDEIAAYINAPHSATTFQDHSKGPTRPVTKIITAEVVYYQMISFGIPLEVEKWHFNKLLSLLRVFAAKHSKEKMSPQEAAAKRHALNQQRLAATKGGRI